jgi:hypothetical protein
MHLRGVEGRENMKAWMIKNPGGVLLPVAGGWYRPDTIKSFVANCDWYSDPTWRKLKRDGFSVVKVEIQECE